MTSISNKILALTITAIFLFPPLSFSATINESDILGFTFQLTQTTLVKFVKGPQDRQGTAWLVIQQDNAPPTTVKASWAIETDTTSGNDYLVLKDSNGAQIQLELQDSAPDQLIFASTQPTLPSVDPATSPFLWNFFSSAVSNKILFQRVKIVSGTIK